MTAEFGSTVVIEKLRTFTEAPKSETLKLREVGGNRFKSDRHYHDPYMDNGYPVSLRGLIDKMGWLSNIYLPFPKPKTK